jgi:DNA-binding transcriptional LysR family regulator
MLARLRRDTWNWLPAFLEVADAGSVQAAAKRLALTPAAVSRTLGLLEGALGEPLFNRVGRGLVLNPVGAQLRAAVRAAAEHVDRGLGAVAADPMAGPLRVSSIGVLTDHVVVPALIGLRRAHAALRPEHLVFGAADANARLLRGELDVAFYYERLTVDGVVATRLGETHSALYCGRGHPLFARRKVTEADVLAHPFSVPQIGDSGQVLDGWPSEVPRLVGMRITMLASNVQVCEAGLMLTVLPELAARPGVAAGTLRRLPCRPLPPIEVFAARAAAGRAERADAMIEAARARLGELHRGGGRAGPGGRASVRS